MLVLYIWENHLVMLFYELQRSLIYWLFYSEISHSNYLFIRSSLKNIYKCQVIFEWIHHINLLLIIYIANKNSIESCNSNTKISIYQFFHSKPLYIQFSILRIYFDLYFIRKNLTVAYNFMNIMHHFNMIQLFLKYPDVLFEILTYNMLIVW